MTMGLTARQSECLAFIQESIREYDQSPSYNMIAVRLGLRSKSGVVRLINALVERGFVRKLDNRARSLELVGKMALCPHCANPIGSARCAQAARAERAEKYPHVLKLADHAVPV